MEVTYGRITQSEILETVLQSDIEKIKMTLSAIDHKAFNWAIDTLLEAKRIYVVGIRSCAPPVSYTHLDVYKRQQRERTVRLRNTERFSEVRRSEEKNQFIRTYPCLLYTSRCV